MKAGRRGRTNRAGEKEVDDCISSMNENGSDKRGHVVVGG